MKGCQLRCKWCHNPETFLAGEDILFLPVKCIHCGRCVAVCPEHHLILGDQMVYLRENCLRCGKCADACPAGALNRCSREMTVEQVMDEVRKDLHFYRQTGGGVTLSGGECLLQPDFSASLLEACKQENIHTAIETALFVPWKNVERVLPFTDLVYGDLKIPHREKHRFYTGQDPQLIWENLRKLSHLPCRLILRVPLIPGVNDSPQDMGDFAAIIRTFGKNIEGIELLRYNHLAESKYEIIGMSFAGFGKETQSDEVLKALSAELEKEIAHSFPVFFRPSK